MSPVWFLYAACFLALFFAFWNGANDRPNSIATIVRTKALSYHKAVIWAGILNFLGPFLTVAVAKTIAKGIVLPEFVTQEIILAGLAGAIVWSAFATWRGIPVSITHSLVGGVLGAGLAMWQSFDVLAMDKLFSKIVLGIALAPVVGFVMGYAIEVIVKHIAFRVNPTKYAANRFWRWGQVISSSWLSLSHGMNDGLNAVGIIALAYFVAGFSAEIAIHNWMIFASAAAIGLGTAVAGYRVMRTVGWDITHLDPIDGFAAEMAAASVLTVKSFIGMPVSTTHVAVSGILGAGGAKSLCSVNWKVTNKIFIAWILTIPAAAMVGAVSHFVLTLFL